MLTFKIPRLVAAKAIPDFENGGWTVWDLHKDRRMFNAPQNLTYDEACFLAHELSKLLLAMYYR